MSLDLDDRQRAMLEEMGVHVWWPSTPALLAPEVAAPLPASTAEDAINTIASPADRTRASGQNDIKIAPPAAPTTVPDAPPAVAQPNPLATGAPANQRPVARPPAPAAHTAKTGPTTLLPLADGITQMDWPTLSATVMQCQACSLCLGRQTPVMAAPASTLHADWLVVGDPPDDAQERAGQPFVDDAGKLLDNMLKAVGVSRFQSGLTQASAAETLTQASTTAYLSLALKCRPALPTTPDAHAVSACANFLRREIALVQPKVILAMGRFAMQLLLSEDHPQGLKLPLGKLRGQVWHYQGVPVVVTYPSSYLLRVGQDKARAWEDLCLAQDVAQGMAAPGG